MNKPLKICTAALALAVSCSIYADDWAGPYAGALIGYSQADDSSIGYQQGNTTPNGWTSNASLDGLALGIFGGYNWTLDNGMLFSLEGEYQHRHDHDGGAFQKYNGTIDTDYSLDTEIKTVASLRVRAGHLSDSKKTLAYVSAGLTAAKVKHTWNDFFIIPETETQSNWHRGWTAGIGAEHKYNDNLSIRAEVRHSDYGDKTIKANLWNEKYKTDLTEETLVVGLSYGF